MGHSNVNHSINYRQDLKYASLGAGKCTYKEQLQSYYLKAKNRADVVEMDRSLQIGETSRWQSTDLVINCMLHEKALPYLFELE